MTARRKNFNLLGRKSALQQLGEHHFGAKYPQRDLVSPKRPAKVKKTGTAARESESWGRDDAEKALKRWKRLGYNPEQCARTKKTKVSDRAKRYRANQPGCRPAGLKKCKLCGSRSDVMVDHVDGNESNGKKGNLRWLCRSCNNTLGAEMARLGIGRRTVQYNPKGKGAANLFEYMLAVLQHTRGAHDAGGKIIHETPKSKRREYAAQIWAARGAHGTMRPGSGRAGQDEPDWVTNPANPSDEWITIKPVHGYDFNAQEDYTIPTGTTLVPVDQSDKDVLFRLPDGREIGVRFFLAKEGIRKKKKKNPAGRRGRSSAVPWDFPVRGVYQPRFIRSDQVNELINLYHLARVPLSGTGRDTRYERMLWASKEFAKLHPEVSSMGAYKDLDGQLSNPETAPARKVNCEAVEYRLGYNLGQMDRQTAALRKTDDELTATFKAQFPPEGWPERCAVFVSGYDDGFHVGDEPAGPAGADNPMRLAEAKRIAREGRSAVAVVDGRNVAVRLGESGRLEYAYGAGEWRSSPEAAKQVFDARESNPSGYRGRSVRELEQMRAYAGVRAYDNDFMVRMQGRKDVEAIDHALKLARKREAKGNPGYTGAERRLFKTGRDIRAGKTHPFGAARQSYEVSYRDETDYGNSEFFGTKAAALKFAAEKRRSKDPRYPDVTVFELEPHRRAINPRSKWGFGVYAQDTRSAFLSADQVAFFKTAREAKAFANAHNDELKAAGKWYSQAEPQYTVRKAFDESAARANPARRNPETDGDDSDEYKQAVKIAELFHGRPVVERITVTESIRSHDWYVRIGPMVSLKVRTVTKANVFIPFDQSEKGMVHLFVSPDGRQFYLRGGDQELDLDAVKMGPGSDWFRDQMIIGDAKEITYRDKKKFHKFKLTDYYHKLGEETGVKPVLAYDSLAGKLSLIGGQYRIETDNLVEDMSPGIVN